MDQASTQYGDLKGTASGDGHPPRYLEELAALAEVDTNLYRPVGIRVWGTPPKIVALYAVEIASIGASATHEALQAVTRENPERVRMLEARFPEDIPLERYLKQFEAIITWRGIDFSRVEISN